MLGLKKADKSGEKFYYGELLSVRPLLTLLTHHKIVVANQADKGQDTNLPPIGTRKHGETLTLRASFSEVAMDPKIQMGGTQTGDPTHCSHSLAVGWHLGTPFGWVDAA